MCAKCRQERNAFLSYWRYVGLMSAKSAYSFQRSLCFIIARCQRPVNRYQIYVMRTSIVASKISFIKIGRLLLLLLLAPSLWAQTPHPRIWLDSTTMIRLTALKNANDASWVTLKA